MIIISIVTNGVIVFSSTANFVDPIDIRTAVIATDIIDNDHVFTSFLCGDDAVRAGVVAVWFGTIVLRCTTSTFRDTGTRF